MTSGANNSRLVSMQYPNGRILNFIYNATGGNGGLDDTISRLDCSVDQSTGTYLENLSFLGLGTIVQRLFGETNVRLTYIQQSGDTGYIGYSGSGDAGDQYTGLDRFGRVIDQFWWDTNASHAKDRFQYAYDRDSNALSKNNLTYSSGGTLTSLSELYHPNAAASGDNATAYDPLSRLQNFQRGTLSVSGSNYNGSSGQGSLDTVATQSGLSSHQENWSLDALGNWGSLATDGGSAVSRTHNSKNEVTAVSGLTSPTFDNNGNTTKDQAGQTYTYDAWNRMISVTNSSSTLLATYAYDAQGWRVQETHSGTTTDCYFDDQWQLIEEQQSATTTNQYVWSQAYIDALVLRDDNSTTGDLGKTGSGLGRRIYVQQDANWNTTSLIGLGGTVEERFVYDPYGNAQCLTASGSSTSDSYSWNYLHQGGRLDTATGLYAFRRRDYSPLLGRWMEQEPDGAIYIDGANLYLSDRSDPVVVHDPTGRGTWMYDGICMPDPSPPPPPKCNDCWQTCLANQAGIMAGKGGAVICRADGCKCACVNESVLGGFPPTGDPADGAIRDCALAHEECHVGQKDTTACACQQYPCLLTHKNGKVHINECQCVQVEVNCLEAKLKAGVCAGDAMCEDKIQSDIAQERAYCAGIPISQ